VDVTRQSCRTYSGLQLQLAAPAEPNQARGVSGPRLPEKNMGCQAARSDLCFSPCTARMLPDSNARSRPWNSDGKDGRTALCSSTLRASAGWSCAGGRAVLGRLRRFRGCSCTPAAGCSGVRCLLVTATTLNLRQPA